MAVRHRNLDLCALCGVGLASSPDIRLLLVAHRPGTWDLGHRCRIAVNGHWNRSHSTALIARPNCRAPQRTSPAPRAALRTNKAKQAGGPQLCTWVWLHEGTRHQVKGLPYVGPSYTQSSDPQIPAGARRRPFCCSPRPRTGRSGSGPMWARKAPKRPKITQTDRGQPSGCIQMGPDTLFYAWGH